MEQKESDDARYSKLLTPTRTPVKLEDDDIKGTGASPDGERSPATVSQGTCAREKHTVYWFGSPTTWIRYPRWMLRFLTMSGPRS